MKTSVLLSLKKKPHSSIYGRLALIQIELIYVYVSFYRFARVGSVVLAIHDANDVILELAKLSKYLGFEVCASIAFVLFVVSWVLLRLIYFPSFVIWSTR